MKRFFKPILLAVTVTAGMLLSGCSSGLDPNTFTVELDVIDTSNWYAQNQSATVIESDSLQCLYLFRHQPAPHCCSYSLLISVLNVAPS